MTDKDIFKEEMEISINSLLFESLYSYQIYKNIGRAQLIFQRAQGVYEFYCKMFHNRKSLSEMISRDINILIERTSDFKNLTTSDFLKTMFNIEDDIMENYQK